MNPIKSLMHDNDNLCELWHKGLGFLHCGVLSILKDMVQGLLNSNKERGVEGLHT